ncbi:MAG: SpoIIE family protein phosphatase [Bryobacteraceae bacterium]|nr:SpoIIE family protein phosphatase [Bryobacteraceae bacterium]
MINGEILVVDDEADLELLVRHNFRKRIAAGELKFHFAGDGEQALRIIDSHPLIELVVTDINMPVMDGLTLLKKAGELRRILKTVIISAYDDMENIRAAMNGGAYDFLTKPIDFADLERTIDKTQRELQILRQGREAQEELLTLEHELRIATRLQQAILPEVITGREEFEIAASMAAARRVSGDFYDFFLIDANRLGLAIGDVSGKGIPAALFMAVSRTLLRATALQGGSPGEVLEHVNRVLLKQSGGEIFLTLIYGVLDLETGDFRFSSGGQPPAYLSSSRQTGRFLREPGGLMLGVMEDARYMDGQAHLDPGDGLLFYTDGVTEAENAAREFFTEARLKTALENARDRSAEHLLEEVLSSVNLFTKGLEQGDDLTLLAVRFRPQFNQQASSTAPRASP